MNDRNHEIKEYVAAFFAGEDEQLKHAHENSIRHGLPNIHIPSHVGKLIYLLTKLRSPKKVLEIGTLSGYSTLWIARALSSDGRIVTLELESEYAELARQHLTGYEEKVEIRIGDAAQSLQVMIDKKEGPFDLIFIDADKENYPAYLKFATALATSGTLILTDNLIPKDEAIDNPNAWNKSAAAIFQFNRELAAHPDLESVLSTTIVGDSGRVDALGISIVK